MHLALFGTVVEQDWLDIAPVEALLDAGIGLETPDHGDAVEMFFVDLLKAAMVALIIQKLKQGREGFREAVVRCGAQKQLVFKVRADFADKVGSLTVAQAAPAGSHVVALIHQQHAELARVGGTAVGGEQISKYPQYVVLFKEIVRRDEARIVRPGVDVNTLRAPNIVDCLMVYDAEIQSELIAHLLLPLDLKR